MVFALLIVLARANGAPNCTPGDTTKWLADSLNQMQTIHSGMARQDLAKVFKPAGGFFSSTRFKGKFVYRDSPYISVDVEFARPARETDDNSPASPKDVIISVSRPYLAQPVFD
jgi:hypothetical protein